MDEPARTMKAFYKRELAVSTPVVFPDSTGSNTCTSVFEKLKDKAMSLGTQQIHRCTVLLIVSRTGVYIGHYWENMAFLPEKGYINKGETPDVVFDRIVINGLTDGKANAGTIEQVSLREKAAKIMEDDHIKGYLIVPDSSPKETAEEYKEYKKKWAKMRETIGNIIPALKDEGNKDDKDYKANPNWKMILYSLLEPDREELLNGLAGMMLFKYDPEQGAQKKSAFWVEDSKDA